MRLASGSDSVAVKATSGVVSLNWNLYECGNVGDTWSIPSVTRVTPLALVIARSKPTVVVTVMSPALSTASPCGERLIAPSAALACACVLRKFAVNFTSPLAGFSESNHSTKYRCPLLSLRSPHSIACSLLAETNVPFPFTAKRSSAVSPCRIFTVPLMICSVWPRRWVMMFSVRAEKISFSFSSSDFLGLKSPVMTKPAFSPSTSPLILRLPTSAAGGSPAWPSAAGLAVANKPTANITPVIPIFLIGLFITSYRFYKINSLQGCAPC